MKASDRAKEGQGAKALAVRLTAKQEAALFDERTAKRDGGSLRHLLRGERTLAGSHAELALAAHHLERSLVAARAVSNEQTDRRARFLAGALARLARAGVEPQAPERAPRVGTQGVGLLTLAPEAQVFPALPKPLHPSKRNRVWFEVEERRRGSGQGARDASRRAWATKVSQRASEVPLIGDAVFTSERATWLRAGSTREEQREARRQTREARKRIARAHAREEIAVRFERAVEVALRKRTAVRPGHVAALLVAEDVRGEKFKRDSDRAKKARAQYTKIAKKRLALREPSRVIGVAARVNPQRKRKRKRERGWVAIESARSAREPSVPQPARKGIEGVESGKARLRFSAAARKAALVAA